MKADHRRRTKRITRGGGLSELQSIIAEVPMIPTIVNPNSKFVVVTYWWGRGNLNRNTQRPCPEDITDILKKTLEEELITKDQTFAELNSKFTLARDAFRNASKASYIPFGPRNMTTCRSDRLSTPQSVRTEFRKMRQEKAAYLSAHFKKPETIEEIKSRSKEYENKLRSDGKLKEPILFETMIENWKNTCAAAGCNHMAVEYRRFAQPGGYQIAINAKPLFIRKSLEVLNGRGALYIDGDMIIKKYPSIFDMPNVDFMARGWNIDPRGENQYEKFVCFDPYVLETSGGTMYFSNSPAAKILLKQGELILKKPANKGKADDRMLSVIFAGQHYLPHINTIQLPIEYLWLGDMYNNTINPRDINKNDIYIEHPECLTGEERASEQSSGSSDRMPELYGPVVESGVNCARRGGVFYERIFFPKKEMVSAFAPFLKYMKNARHHETKRALFEVVDFEDGYGRYNTISLQNREAAKTVQVPLTDARLPLNTPIPVILAYLLKGVDVKLGQIGQVPPLTECMITNIHENEQDQYPNRIGVDINKPIFFSANNPILIQLVAMCKTLADINIHLEESYVFVSRIRWSFDED